MNAIHRLREKNIILENFQYILTYMYTRKYIIYMYVYNVITYNVDIHIRLYFYGNASVTEQSTIYFLFTKKKNVYSDLIEMFIKMTFNIFMEIQIESAISQVCKYIRIFRSYVLVNNFVLKE